MTKERSRIFSKGRALGYVSTGVPAASRYLQARQEHVVVTSVGRAFHSYGVNHFSLLTVSDSIPSDITCLQADRYRVFTGSSDGHIRSWKRGTLLVRKFEPAFTSPVQLLLLFGPQIIAVSENNELRVWHRSSGEVALELPLDSNTFKVSTIIHPSTYLNKILLGSEQGTLQLWNIKTASLIHTFNQWNGTGVTALSQAPALDTVAIGLNDGRIIIHNLKFDETIMEYKQDWGAVTCLSFRLDNQPILASGSHVGHIVLWNLEEQTVASQILSAHDGSVSSLECLAGEPLMVSTSPDNSLKLWIFDQPDFGGRLLRVRAGHPAQPNIAKFYLSNPNHVLTTGDDSSMRVFNLINESMNFSMGRAYYNRKTAKKNKEYAETLLMPSVSELTMTSTREKDWDNIVTIHRDSPLAVTWSYNKRRLGDHKLLPQRWTHATRATLNVVATCLQATNCGNFVVIGYSSGHLERFNVQSGIHRCSYGTPSAHSSSLRGVAVDPFNQFVVSGCGEGIVKFWKFRLPQSPSLCENPLAEIKLEDSITFFKVHQESNLMCAVLEDFSVNIVDFETRKVVRRLKGHRGQVTDATFSPDARWLLTSSIDSTIRTWDIPTGSLIDIFKTDAFCVSLDMSPNGQYLATVHANCLGVYIWTNKTLYTQVSFRPLDKQNEEEIVSLTENWRLDGDSSDEEDGDVANEEKTSSSSDQIDGLITFSGIAGSRWKNLLDYDVIKARNKPDESALIKPKIAPFFLPQLPPTTDQDIRFDLKDDAADEEARLSRLKLYNTTVIGRALARISTDVDRFALVERFKGMGPAGVHGEITGLVSVEEIAGLLRVIGALFAVRRDVELSEAWLGVCLKSHANEIAESETLSKLVDDIERVRSESWSSLEDSFTFSLSALSIIRELNNY